MAYLQARAGIARSGVTYAGWTPPAVKVTINGTDRTSSVLAEEWAITLRRDAPPSFTFRVKDFTPTLWHDVVVYYATPNDYLFAGTLLQVEAAPVAPNSSVLQWSCMAVGYEWLINRYDKVTKKYLSVGVNTMVGDILATYANGPSYSVRVQADNPVGHWRLGETSGTTATDEEATNNGTYTGTVTLNQPGAVPQDPNRAILVAGAGSVVVGDVFDFAGTAACSVECWVKLTAIHATAFERIVSKEVTDGGGTQGWWLGVDPATASTPGAVLFIRRLNGAADEKRSATGLVVGQWTHVLATYDGTSMRIYLNGVESGSAVTSSKSILNHAGNLTFGARSGGTVFLNAALDEVALYNAALTATQAAAHHAAAVAPRFRVGYIPSSLGNLTMDFTFENVMDALERITKAVDSSTLVIRPDRVVDLYVTYPEGALDTLTESDILAGSFAYRQDGTQVRTRTVFRGGGSSATAVVSPGASTIPVEDTARFEAGGGQVIADVNIITYTGRSVASGPGSLTGVSGVLSDIAAGDAIDVLEIATNATDTTALAAALGFGLSGQATHALQDGRLSADESAQRAAADLTTFGTSIKDVDWTYKTFRRDARVGQVVQVAITAPVSLSGSFGIQAISLVPYGPTGGATVSLRQHVATTRFVRSLTQLLQQLPG